MRGPYKGHSPFWRDVGAHIRAILGRFGALEGEGDLQYMLGIGLTTVLTTGASYMKRPATETTSGFL